MGDTDVHTTLNFMQRLLKYRDEKPYSINYRVPGWEHDVPRSNYKMEAVEDVLVRDIRGREDSYSFDTHGFGVVEMQSSLSYDEYANRKIVDEVYCQELASCLLQYFPNAAAVHVFDIEIRRRHPEFPNIRMNVGMDVQPGARVHVDGTLDAYNQLLGELESPAAQYSRHLFLNAWKPLKGPIFDWPLAICDPNSVDPLIDYSDHDNIYADAVRENVMVFHNPAQRWHYLSAQMPSEILLFRQADSEGRTAVPHTAFQLPHDHSNTKHVENFRRESIEARVVICFEN